MSLADVNRARAAWFEAPDLDARFAAVQGLREGARPWVEWSTRTVALRHLIELIHYSDHPSLRARLIEPLGLAGSITAVPALHAELHHPSVKVRGAAIEALGELGLLFGGAVVARWLVEQRKSTAPPVLRDEALRTLALTGHPDTAKLASLMFQKGEVEATTFHLALAEAVSTTGVELAEAHLRDPEAAIPAALHLSAVRHPQLEKLLAPLLRSADLQQRQVAEALVARRWEGAQDDVLHFISDRLYGRDLGRRARRLRVHAPDELVAVFELFCEEHPVGSRARAKFLTRMAAIGVPELQAAMFEWALDSKETANLVTLLRAASTRHASLAEELDRLMGHSDAEVVVGALRCRVNLLSDQQPGDLVRWAKDPRPAVAEEAVRSAMTLFRDRKQPNRKTALTGAGRRALEQMMRQTLREGSTNARVQAAFAVGNLGLTALTDELLRLKTDADARVRQGAAASLHGLPPGKKLDELVSWLGEESAPDVRMRLGLALLDALDGGQPAPSGLEAVATGSLQGREDLELVGLHLCGFVAQGPALERLRQAVGDPRLATSAAALTALGRTRQPKLLPLLEEASRLEDPVRRRRAVEALGVFGSPAAATALVKVAVGEPEPSVRRAALRSLTRCPCSPAEARQLVARGASDPLMYELLEAHVAATGGGLDVVAVDAGLEERFGGLKVGLLARKSEDALRALRTAYYLDSGVQLPEGLDAAPPVVFWAKGLELWMNAVLRPVLQDLRSPRGRKALAAVSYVWSEWERGTAGWTPQGKGRWASLRKVAARSAEDRGKTWTLRALAAAVLCSGPLAKRMELEARLGHLPPELLGQLADDLVSLSDLRNRLTHESSGRALDASQASRRANAIGRCLATHFR